MPDHLGLRMSGCHVPPQSWLLVATATGENDPLNDDSARTIPLQMRMVVDL